MKAVQGVGVVAAGAAVKALHNKSDKIADAVIKNGALIQCGVTKTRIAESYHVNRNTVSFFIKRLMEEDRL